MVLDSEEPPLTPLTKLRPILRIVMPAQWGSPPLPLPPLCLEPLGKGDPRREGHDETPSSVGKNLVINRQLIMVGNHGFYI